MQQTPTRLLGIDPGLARTGFGIISAHKRDFNALDFGYIKTEAHEAMPHRLEYIYTSVRKLLEKHQPQALAIETLFFNKNISSALLVGQAKGVIILAAQHSKIPVFEYSPLQIKMAITGYGKADKQQMQKMVKVLLRLQKIPKPDHAADALAAALCLAHHEY